MTAEAGSQRHQAPDEIIAGRYQLTRLIARGGMGEVFAAYDRSKQRAVALKRLLTRSDSQRGQVAHFMREYYALSALKHPRIIEVYEYGVDRDVPYYTMELLDGQDLRDLSPLPYREACRYLRDVASSLALLHARRLLHRDVSPRNVRRTSDGHCKLLDFGAMVAFGVPPNITGTAPCIAPEALHGASLDQRSDLYSLGALAYCLLTGRHGYAVSQIEELPDAWRKPLQPPKRTADIPTALNELVMSLMNLDVMKRPKSAAEVIDWLSAVGELEPDEVTREAKSFFTSTPLCGREQPSEALARHIKRALHGHGGAVLVTGGMGSGKSRMLSEAVLIAQTLGVNAVQGVARKQRLAAGGLIHEWIMALQQVAPVEAELAGVKRIVWPRVLSAAVDNTADKDKGPTELRSRQQQQLMEVICGIARARPILLTVDDLEHADESSLALVASLAHEANRLPLLIVASCERAKTATSAELNAFANAATPVDLQDLDGVQSDALVRSMFGSPHNIQIVSDWLFKNARGNPKLTLELAEYLFKHDLIRYVDGAWVMPTGEITLRVPSDLTDVWMLRMQGVSASARELLDLLSIRRGGISTEVCLAMSKQSASDTFAALDELVRVGVIESAGNEYVFAQEAMRQAIAQNIDGQRLSELHERWAETLLADPAADLEVRLEAGWHLIHSPEEARGADLLAEVAPLFVDRGVALAMAIPALERALEVSERLGRPLALRLRLRSALVLAGYLFDYRLAFRYGEETLDLLQHLTGLGTAKRLAKYLGPVLALLVGLVGASLRRIVSPASRRGPPVYLALKYFVRAAMGMIGVRATSLDLPGVSAIYEKVTPLAASPSSTSGRMIYLACRTLRTQMSGREGQLKREVDEALQELRRGRRSDMGEYEYHSLLVGMLLCDGLNESYKEASEALARADMLDSIGTHIARASAERIRMIYYARRGDAERAEECRRRIELQAIQGGTVWQGEWFSVPLEGLAGATWSDLVGVRRAMERLERLAEEVPALGSMRDSARVTYHFRRGEYARAAKLGIRYMAAYPPHQLVGWAPAYGIIALSLIELGQVDRARRLCENALSVVSEEDLSYFVMYAPLEVAHATALATSGEYERGKQIVAKRIERLRAHGEHASIVNLYQYQARMSQLVGDDIGVAIALQAMREAALTSGLPAVILLADRVAELRAKRRSSPLPAPLEPEAPRAEEKTAVTKFLLKTPPGRARGREALWLLARYTGCEGVSLYRLVNRAPVLVASVPDAEEIPAVTLALFNALQIAKVIPPGSTIELDQPGVPEVANNRLLMLPIGDGGGTEALVGAVVLRAGSETRPEVSRTMLRELASIIAEDIRTTIAPTGTSELPPER
ncbi:MAG TPA: protein kinase [Polyangiales bacterium]|nr:protein kinase [Polyangiales bacterium]